MPEPTELERQLWKMLAFCSRYGHQPLSELRRLPMSDLGRYAKELSNIVKEENPEPNRMD